MCKVSLSPVWKVGGQLTLQPIETGTLGIIDVIALNYKKKVTLQYLSYETLNLNRFLSESRLFILVLWRKSDVIFSRV